MKKYFRTDILVILLLCNCCSLAFALTNEEVFSQFQFNFITPGARATALGGAFIGLADDATAVESNPAGLTALTLPEMFGEFKHITYTTEQIYANHSLDTEITRKEYNNVVESIPFLSAVYPYKRFVFSLYRQELVNYATSYRTSSSSIIIPGTYDPLTGSILTVRPTEASVDLTVTNYGIGIAFQMLNELSLAISPRRSHMNMKSYSTTFGANSPAGVTDFTEADIMWGNSINDEDVSYSFNIGVLWEPQAKFSLGAVYKDGPKFRMQETLGAVMEYDTDNAECTVKIPDSFGIGLAFRATTFLTLTLDILHIQYEDLLEDFDIVFNQQTLRKDNFTIDNATEIHVGVEYILALGQQYLALRAGVYNEPDHTIRFTGTTGDRRDDIFYKALYPGGDDQLHITGGLGLIMNEHFQIDSAANIAEKSTLLSLSAVYRF